MTDINHNTSSHLNFLTEWKIIQNGRITPGEKLIIEYDVRRLPNLRKNWRGADIWNMEIYIRFHPGGELHIGSLLEAVRVGVNANVGGGMAVDHFSKPFEIVIPMGAAEMELWFRTFDNVGGFIEAWDSNFGKNYWFEVNNR